MLKYKVLGESCLTKRRRKRTKKKNNLRSVRLCKKFCVSVRTSI